MSGEASAHHTNFIALSLVFCSASHRNQFACLSLLDGEIKVKQMTGDAWRTAFLLSVSVVVKDGTHFPRASSDLLLHFIMWKYFPTPAITYGASLLISPRSSSHQNENVLCGLTGMTNGSVEICMAVIKSCCSLRGRVIWAQPHGTFGRSNPVESESI